MEEEPGGEESTWPQKQKKAKGRISLEPTDTQSLVLGLLTLKNRHCSLMEETLTNCEDAARSGLRSWVPEVCRRENGRSK